MITIWRRLAQLIQVVEWPCGYCATTNETSRLLWPTVRTSLICGQCSRLQNYPDHIRQFDPLPIGRAR